MKKRLLCAAICSAVLSINVSATMKSATMKSATKFKFIGDTQYAELCQAAATNNLVLFKNNVKHHGIRLNSSHKKMLTLLANDELFKCAGQGLVRFSKERGSLDITDYLEGTEAKVETVSTSKYKFVGDNSFKNFCKSAVTDSVDLFKRAVSRQIGSLGASKKEVMNKVLAADSVTCAGEGLTEFFEQRQASNVLGYIAQSLE